MEKSTLERIFPDEPGGDPIGGNETRLLHIERYEFAKQFITGRKIADIACGSGYGSFILASAGNDIDITSIDIDKETIAYAANKYKHTRIHFLCEDVMNYVADPCLLFDTIVSFETIEHLQDPESFVALYSRRLNTGGRFIASVPITPSMDANPYHLHDFSARTFRKLFIKEGFKELASFVQIQKYNPIKIIKKEDSRSKDLRPGLFTYYLRNPGKFGKRVASIVKDGFTNKYFVAAFEKSV